MESRGPVVRFYKRWNSKRIDRLGENKGMEVETIGGGGRVIRAVGTLLGGASHGIVSCGKRARNRNCGHASVGQRGSRPAPRVGPGTVPAWGNGQGMKMNAHVPFPNK